MGGGNGALQWEGKLREITALSSRAGSGLKSLELGGWIWWIVFI